MEFCTENGDWFVLRQGLDFSVEVSHLVRPQPLLQSGERCVKTQIKGTSEEEVSSSFTGSRFR